MSRIITALDITPDRCPKGDSDCSNCPLFEGVDEDKYIDCDYQD